METGLLEKVDPILEKALDMDKEDRRAYLNEVCGDDVLLLGAVEELLAIHTKADEFLQTTRHLREEMEHVFGGDKTEMLGKRFGAYRTVEEIGRGGMGMVFLAHRDDGQFTRNVALKLLSRGLHSDAGRDMFKQELSILARLKHPNIALLHDSGVSQDGLPFFIMEYLEATPITQFADEHQLSISARLNLFLQVCDAVQYAHANMVIHRDIKPSNILVTTEGRAKLLDFGIARSLSDNPTGAQPLVTDKLMTPEYAAPEQLLGGNITVATDIYALGGLLYQLLTGSRPIRATGLSTYGLFREMAQKAPTPLSQCPISAEDAAARDTSIINLRTMFKGDLEMILTKALEKRPEDRYFTVEALAEDLRRYLAHRPVEAHPQTFSYVTSRYIRRNWLPVSALAGFVIMLLGFGLGMTYLWRQARTERDLARTERDTANRITNFITGIFEHSAPEVSLGTEVTTRELLDQGLVKIRSELKDEPEVRAKMLTVLGKVHTALGHYEKANNLFREAVDSRRAHPQDGQFLADTLLAWSENETRASHYPEAEKLLTEAELLLKENPPHDVLLTTRALAARTHYLKQTAQYKPALQTAEQLIAAYDGMKPSNPILRAEALLQKGDIFRFLGQYDQSIQFNEQAIALFEASLEQEHPSISAALNQTGLCYREKGDLEKAEAAFRRALAISEKIYAPNHPELAATKNNLAAILKVHGKLEEATDLYIQALEIIEQRAGERHAKGVAILNNLAEVYYLMGRKTDSIDTFKKALTIGEQILGPEHPTNLSIRSNLAVLYYSQNKFDEALLELKRALALRSATLGEFHPDQIETYNTIGAIYNVRAEYDAAIASFEKAIAIAKNHYDGDHPQLLNLLSGLARAYQAQKKYDLAAPILREAVAKNIERAGEDHAMTGVYRTSLSHVLIDQGLYAEAEREIAIALPLAQKAYPAGHYRVLKLQGLHAICKARLQQYQEAESLLADVYRQLKGQTGREAFRSLIAEELGKVLAAAGHEEKAASYGMNMQ